MSIYGNKSDPYIEWERGPDHPANLALYGTSVVDPNDPNKINIYGGLIAQTAGVMIPSISSVANTGYLFNYEKKTQFVGSRATRRHEVFTIPENINEIGNFSDYDEYYLGPSMHYDRNMHFATLLPTKEILIVGGGNYNYYGSVKSPLLLTPIYNGSNQFTGEYTKTFLVPQRRPRYYHSVSLLLPDGRVLSGGGNPSRAILDWTAAQSIEEDDAYNITMIENRQPLPNLERANLLNYRQIGRRIAQTYSDCEAEVFEIEIFTPPYSYIDCTSKHEKRPYNYDNCRDPEIESFEWINAPSGVSAFSILNDKIYYLIHSNETYEIVLNSLPDSNECDLEDSSVVLMKLGSASHGWDVGQKLYSLSFEIITQTSIQFIMPNQSELNIVPAYYMLFFVDCKGKPAKSIMVRFDDDASQAL